MLIMVPLIFAGIAVGVCMLNQLDRLAYRSVDSTDFGDYHYTVKRITAVYPTGSNHRYYHIEVNEMQPAIRVNRSWLSMGNPGYDDRRFPDDIKPGDTLDVVLKKNLLNYAQQPYSPMRLLSWKLENPIAFRVANRLTGEVFHEIKPGPINYGWFHSEGEGVLHKQLSTLQGYVPNKLLIGVFLLAPVGLLGFYIKRRWFPELLDAKEPASASPDEALRIRLNDWERLCYIVLPAIICSAAIIVGVGWLMVAIFG